MRRYLPHVIILAVVAAAYLTGHLVRLDYRLMEWRFQLAERTASQDIVVVAIDQRSLRELDVWPWPRRYHAELIERLDDAGAALIAIDIDFSSRSSPEHDRILADALTAADGKVALPVFRQLSGRGGELVEIGPSSRFAGAVQLGSVTAQPGKDGMVRRADTAMVFADRQVPSLAALLAGLGEIVDRRFYVDYAINPATLPSVSYVDVLRGDFPEGYFAGRRVLVGATAVELGDQLPVPIHLTLPGPYYLALAAESMVQGRTIVRTGALPTLAIALLLSLFAAWKFPNWSWGRGLAFVAGWSLVVFTGSAVLQAAMPISVDLAAWLIVPALSFVASLFNQIDRQAIRIFRQRMAVLHRSTMMRQLVESSFDGILAVDRTGRISLHNPAAAQIFGYDTDDLPHVQVGHLLRLGDEGLGREELEPLQEMEGEPPSLLEGTGIRRDGSTFDVEVSLRRVPITLSRHPLERRQAERTYLFMTVRDITARRDMERAREKATQEAVAANRAKSEFLAAMSHELRTPLNAIIGFSEMISNEMLGPLGNDTYRGYVEDIHRSGGDLLSIVNDILDVARIEAGRHELNEETVDIGAVAETCRRLIVARPEARDLNVHVNIPDGLPKLVADARALKQVLLNLLVNAVKFTKKGWVEVAAAADSDGMALIVTDTGVGIPGDQIDLVHRPFHQADSSLAREFEGTGLGLSLVDSLMQLHGGRLEIESTVGKGTTVTCRFPASRLIADDVVDVA